MFKINLRDQEAVVNITRQAESVLVRYALLILVALYFPITFLVKYELLVKYRAFIMAWVIIVALYAIVKYLLWLLNVTIVTDQRAIVVSYQGFFDREIHEAPLAHISHISQRRKGILATLFGYGDVLIQLLGVDEPLVVKNIKHPDRFSNTLWKTIETSRKNQPSQLIPEEQLNQAEEA